MQKFELRRQLQSLYEKGSLTKKSSDMVFSFALSKDSPVQTFLVNKHLLDQIEQQEGDILEEKQVLEIAIQNTTDAVNPHFDSHCLNLVNSTFYSTANAFTEESGLANMYVKNHILNTAIARLMKDLMPRSDWRLKELCTGGNAERWKCIAEESLEKNMHVVLTDFTTLALPPSLEDIATPNISFEMEEYSLFDDLEDLPEEKRFDCIDINYGFDSVWLSEDVAYTKQNGVWFRRKNRVKIADFDPQKEQFIKTLQQGAPLSGGTFDRFDALCIEEIVEPVDDMNAVPFGKYILEAWKDSPSVLVNFPGTLIKRVVQSFEKQVKPDGVFIVGETCYFKKGQTRSMESCSTSGKVAKYKAEDLVLAKEILEKEFHLWSELIPIDHCVERYMGEGWEAGASEEEIEDIRMSPTNCLMIIKKKSETLFSL